MIALLRSMRFAIAVLVVVGVAATIGSILEQNQPAVTYVSHYGIYWSTLFRLARLTDVYHAGWFFALLGFMAASTALCLWQRTPAMWREMRSHRLERSRAALARAEHRAEWRLVPAASARTALRQALDRTGFSTRLRLDGPSWTIAGRRGAGRRAGYLLVHGAMVLICVGGLIDGNVSLRWHMWRGLTVPAPLDMPAERLPSSARLPPDAGSFRAAVKVAEGTRANSAELSVGDGYLLQELPFSLQLQHFEVAHHPNGQPRDFVSSLRIVDGDHTIPVTLRVNHPFTYRGITLFQSGFDDGGSELDLRLRALSGAPDQPLHARVGDAVPILIGGQPVTLEAVELHTVNVMARADALPANWFSQQRPGARSLDAGPSLLLRLRGADGQAEEWQVWQRALTLEGRQWVVLGRRASGSNQMRYLRLPADANGSADAFLAWSAALNRPEARALAGAALARGVPDPALATNLRGGAEHLLERFAAGGLDAIGGLAPPTLAPERRAAGARLYLDLLERAAGLLDPRIKGQAVRDALLAYSEMRSAHAPALIQLDGYRQVQAAVIQVTRAPGASLVYLGCGLLALGVIAMYFVHERRIWLHCDGHTLLLVLDANRPGPQLEAELAALVATLEPLLSQQVKYDPLPLYA